MTLTLRTYHPEDYDQVTALYKQGDLFGGQFDPDRDSAARLQAVTEHAPHSILVAERAGDICGTLSLIKDPRTAWLFRFAVEKEEDHAVASALFCYAEEILKSEGHHQVLVYSPVNNVDLDARYEKLGFKRGNDFGCFWRML